VNTIRVALPEHAQRLYKAMEQDMFIALECGTEVEAFNATSKTIKCLQLANGALYTDDTRQAWEVVHDAKLEALHDIIEEAAGMPVLVAYHFKSDVARLQRAFPKGRALDKNPDTIRDWNAGNIPVLFAHPASAGHGLNLQDGGNILAFFGHWWAQVRNGVLMRTCTVCGGSGTVPISDRKRAAALGRDVSTYCMRWRGLYEWLLEKLRAAEQHAAAELKAALLEDAA
ncbi:ATP-dependent helicase, partial [Xylella fastidiosa subsp. multiplex]|nr:ATP-dependent helicase [Xylella fastidiosa subsp. multiplex]MDD0952892.1 ATP-dependent helicase [Xylella fastidiosa subsp. multiplex]MSS78915.1 ATP-dependent helicase [Xylella fastidiosa subsp. multiplex]